MAVLLRHRVAVDARDRVGLRALVAEPTFELIPLRHAVELSDLLPGGARVSVTSSAARGIEATVALCEALAGRGFRTVPHLSAHGIRDRAQLASLLRRLADAGVRRAFVVGGDGSAEGELPDGLALLRAMTELGHPFTEIGIPCYPQGHPTIPATRLQAALVAKAPYAHYMTTQLCFDPGALAAWLRAQRADGIDLPVHLGVPGPAELPKLLAISARIGVRDTRSFLVKNTRLVRRLLLQPGGFRPDELLDGLAPLIADPAANVVGLHLYTFNQVAATLAWRARYLERSTPG